MIKILKNTALGSIVINIVLNILFYSFRSVDITILLFSFPIGIIGMVASYGLENKKERLFLVFVNLLLTISFIYPFLLWRLASRPG